MKTALLVLLACAPAGLRAQDAATALASARTLLGQDTDENRGPKPLIH